MTKQYSRKKLEEIMAKYKSNPHMPQDPDNPYLPSYEPFLRVIYRYDFLRRKDIQKLLNYQSERNVKWYLSALLALGYINRVQYNQRVYYFLTQRGADILHTIDPTVPKNLHRTPAGMMVLASHNSAVTDVMMSFIENDQVPDRGLLIWRGPLECESMYPYGDTGTPKIIPDAFGYYVCDGGESSFNLELDSGKQSQRIIDEKIRHYYTYFHLNGFNPEEQIVMFVTLLGEQRVQNIISTANAYLKEINSKMRVLVTTIHDIHEYGPYEHIWRCNLTQGKTKHNLYEMAVFEARQFDPSYFLGHEQPENDRRDLLRAVRTDMEAIHGRLQI